MMLAAAGGSKLPAGYAKLEYLESDGTQYIDTGFKPNQDTRVVMDFESLTTDDSAIFGARTAYKKNDYTFWISKNQWLTNYYTESTYIANPPVSGRMLVDKNKNVTTINGVVTTNTYGTFQAPVTMTICTKNENGTLDDRYAKLKIYSCKIYDNGTLIRDFIPAMNASGEAGLYDLKNDVWYGFLKAVAKVENKIEVFVENRATPTGIAITNFWFTANYPLESDILISFAGYDWDSGNGYRSSVWFEKGAKKTPIINTTTYNPSQFLYAGQSIDTITAISPTEDDTYIYTF